MKGEREEKQPAAIHSANATQVAIAKRLKCPYWVDPGDENLLAVSWCFYVLHSLSD